MDREAWHAAVHGVTKSWTGLSDRTELKHQCTCHPGRDSECHWWASSVHLSEVITTMELPYTRFTFSNGISLYLGLSLKYNVKFSIWGLHLHGIISRHPLYLRGFYSFPLTEASWLITLLSSSYVLDCSPFLSLDTVELWTVVLTLSLPYTRHLHTKAPLGTVSRSGIPDLRKGTRVAHVRITISVFQSSSRFKDRPSAVDILILTNTW